MAAPPSTSSFASALVIAGLWLAVPPPAVADPVLAGTVTDAITLQPVAGAEIDIQYAGQLLGAGSTDINGQYSVPFAVPAAAPSVTNLVALARGPAHEALRSSFQIRDGTPVDPVHDIAIYPAGVTACRSQTGHSVIVGHFLPPTGSNVSDLSTRVARSLDFALTTRLQAVHLAPDLQPSFEPCDVARPIRHHVARYAKALLADAFVIGNIEGSQAQYSVRTYISDAHGLMAAPVLSTSTDINLDNPSGARMSGETHAAVLASVAAGLAKGGDCVAAITVLAVAEQMVDAGPAAPAYLRELRRGCESRVPNAGLLGGRP